MLVSWNWLNDYVKLDMELSELENRLSMSGLNHEESRPAEDDVTVDLLTQRMQVHEKTAWMLRSLLS